MLLAAGHNAGIGRTGSGFGGVMMRRVLRSALFQLNEDDFQLAAAALTVQRDGGGGSGSIEVMELPEGPALLVLRLLEQLDGGGDGGRGGSGQDAAAYVAATAPVELLTAEVYRACRHGSWERCLSVLQVCFQASV